MKEVIEHLYQKFQEKSGIQQKIREVEEFRDKLIQEGILHQNTKDRSASVNLWQEKAKLEFWFSSLNKDIEKKISELGEWLGGELYLCIENHPLVYEQEIEEGLSDTTMETIKRLEALGFNVRAWRDEYGEEVVKAIRALGTHKGAVAYLKFYHASKSDC